MDEQQDHPKEPLSYWQEMNQIDLTFYLAVGFICGFLIALLLIDNDFALLGVITALAPEAISIGAGVFVIDRLLKRRDEQVEKGRLKSQLMREIGSRVNAVAVYAAERMNYEEVEPGVSWLNDGSLEGHYLKGANLAGADLNHATMYRAFLWEANLDRVDFSNADLEGVRLTRATARGATFFYTILKSAECGGTAFTNAKIISYDLQGASLRGIKFHGTDLRGSNLVGAEIIFDEHGIEGMFNTETILPDGKVWEPGIDIFRYTRGQVEGEFQRLISRRRGKQPK